MSVLPASRPGVELCQGARSSSSAGAPQKGPSQRAEEQEERKAARRWWERLKREYSLSVRVAFAERLVSREATIAEIYRAKVDSRTTDIGAILHFLDYRRAAQRTRKDKDNR